MPPSAIVDADLAEWDPKPYFVIEAGSVWRASGYGGGAATWEEVWTDTANFSGDTFGALLRIRCATTTGLLYVIGYGQETSGGDTKPFCLRSTNSGLSWVQNWIDEALTEGGSFTLGSTLGSADDPPGMSVFSGGGYELVHTITFPGTQAFQNAKKHVEIILDPPIPQGAPGSDPLVLEYDVIGNCASEDYDADGDKPGYINYQSFLPVVTGTFAPITGGYHFTGELDSESLYGDTIWYGCFDDYTGRWTASTAATRTSIMRNLEIGGVTYNGTMRSAFDVARSNNNWLYLGLDDKIIKSEDGGFTWADWYTTEGANDIHIDPQAAGAVYAWDTAGQLILVVSTIVSGTGILQATIDTESSAWQQHGRIARQLNGGILWYLNISGALYKRENATNTSLVTGISNGRSLKTFLGGTGAKLVYLSGSDIHYSGDAGANWSAKKGGWGASYANPVAIHLLE